MQQNKLCSLTTSQQDVDICRDILYLLLLYDITLVDYDYGIVTYAWITFPLFMVFLKLCVQTNSIIIIIKNFGILSTCLSWFS